MTRAILIVLDSVGCGGAEDAAAYGDEGADTLGHIAEACAEGRGDRDGLRRGPLNLPRLDALGLGHAMQASTGRAPPGLRACPSRAANGAMASRRRAARTRRPAIGRSPARRSISTGVISRKRSRPFQALTEAMIAEGELPGILANRHASGTTVIEDYGEEHLRTLKPICYTSADSVLQIAAHEEAFGLERLYDLCRIARRLCDPLNIGRVIARPFLGAAPRTSCAPPTARTSLCRRPMAISCSGRRAPAARSSRSARSATSSPIATRATSARARATTPMSTFCSTRSRPPRTAA